MEHNRKIHLLRAATVVLLLLVAEKIDPLLIRCCGMCIYRYSGDYPWAVVPLEKRTSYMVILEEASVNQNISTFADFLAQLVNTGLKGKAVPEIPFLNQ